MNEWNRNDDFSTNTALIRSQFNQINVYLKDEKDMILDISQICLKKQQTRSLTP